MKKIYLLISCFAISLTAFGGDGAPAPAQPPGPEPLTLANFFTAGWGEAFTQRIEAPDVAPDIELPHGHPAFIQRQASIDFYNEREPGNYRAVDDVNGSLDYSFNERFMLGATAYQEWQNGRSTHLDRSGDGAQIEARFQLIDVPGSQYAFSFLAGSPNDGIGMKTTQLNPALSGWQDLTKFGLKRMGLYFMVGSNTYAGPLAKGTTRRTTVNYDVSLAKTWTRPDMHYIGDFTTFGQFSTTTTADGKSRGNTTLIFTPGVHFRLGGGSYLIASVDLPVTMPRNIDETYNFSYLLRF